jgi:hypothetical protein
MDICLRQYTALWSKQAHSCHQQTLAMADTLCRMKGKCEHLSGYIWNRPLRVQFGIHHVSTHILFIHSLYKGYRLGTVVLTTTSVTGFCTKLLMNLTSSAVYYGAEEATFNRSGVTSLHNTWMARHWRFIMLLCAHFSKDIASIFELESLTVAQLDPYIVCIKGIPHLRMLYLKGHNGYNNNWWLTG